MPTDAPKYFLFCNNKLVLSNAEEAAVTEKIQSLVTGDQSATDEKITNDSFQLVQGRSVPLTVETGVRVKLTKRVHKNAKGKKKPASTTASTTTTAATPSA